MRDDRRRKGAGRSLQKRTSLVEIKKGRRTNQKGAVGENGYQRGPYEGEDPIGRRGRKSTNMLGRQETDKKKVLPGEEDLVGGEGGARKKTEGNRGASLKKREKKGISEKGKFRPGKVTRRRERGTSPKKSPRRARVQYTEKGHLFLGRESRSQGRKRVIQKKKKKLQP